MSFIHERKQRERYLENLIRLEHVVFVLSATLCYFDSLQTMKSSG